MVLVNPQRGAQSIGVIWIALALVIAAFLGAALGMVWQSSGLGADDEEVLVEDEPVKAPQSAQAH
tara:strand:+ start:12227 stop:12421 length:195 start_codon:yes stop_codon:yes gene_type:complete